MLAVAIMRVLLVLPDASFNEDVRKRCQRLLDEGHEIALCHALLDEKTLQELNALLTESVSAAPTAPNSPNTPAR